MDWREVFKPDAGGADDDEHYTSMLRQHVSLLMCISKMAGIEVPSEVVDNIKTADDYRGLHKVIRYIWMSWRLEGNARMNERTEVLSREDTYDDIVMYSTKLATKLAEATSGQKRSLQRDVKRLRTALDGTTKEYQIVMKEHKIQCQTYEEMLADQAKDIERLQARLREIDTAGPDLVILEETRHGGQLHF